MAVFIVNTTVEYGEVVEDFADIDWEVFVHFVSDLTCVRLAIQNGLELIEVSSQVLQTCEVNLLTGIEATCNLCDLSVIDADYRFDEDVRLTNGVTGLLRLDDGAKSVGTVNNAMDLRVI
jgi:hypothetical protein